MAKERSTFLFPLLTILALFVAGCAASSDSSRPAGGEGVGNSYGAARGAYQSGDYLAAAERLIPLAEGGDPRAQYALGYMYFYGKGVLPDRDRALALFRESARQGNARASEALRLLKEDSANGASALPDTMPVAVAAPNGGGNPENEATAAPVTEVPPAAPPESMPEATSPVTAPLVNAVETAEAVTPPSSAKPDSSPAIRGERGSEWLRNHDPDNLTIQLVAGGELEGVQQFVAEHRLNERVAIVEGQRNGASWFVVLYGVYEGYQAAQAALAALPGDLRVNQPWIRRLGDTLNSR